MAPLPRDSKEWLSLHQASERIGVSPATLRVWADQGRVRSFRTPGGHRRFHVRDVAAWTASPREREDLRWRVLEHSALGHARLALDHSRLERAPWFERFSPEARAADRDLGRKLLRLLMDSLQEDEAEVEPRARQLGREYARVHHRFGIALGDAVGAFIFFRSSFLESVLEFSQGVGDQKGDEILRMYYRLNSVIDHVLLAMIEDHDRRVRN